MIIPFSVFKNTKVEKCIEIFAITLLIILTVVIRFLSLDYLDASDNYNDIAYKNMYENGVSFYRYSTISTHFTLFFIKHIGFGFLSLRAPSIIYSLVTVIFVYFIARRANKHAAMISLFLFAVSPWSIVLSRVTRDYAFDCMVSSIAIFITVLTIKEIHKKNGTQFFINSIILTLTVFAIFLLTKFNNRSQTLIVIISPAIGILFNIYYLLQTKIKNKLQLILISLLIIGVGILLFYHIDYTNLKKGFLFNKYYFQIFFTPWLKSPWQWFHGNNIPKSTAVFFGFFLIPLIYTVFYQKQDINYLLFLYIAFFAGIATFLLKFKSHLYYDPTRYIYFLFPAYVVIYSFSFYYTAVKVFKKNLHRILVLFISLGLFFNVKSIWYAVYPEKAYKHSHISTLYIDNIGIGRFKMNDVCKFLKEEAGWDNEKIFVFGGRYGEFILLLDYKMDSDRYLLRNFGDHQAKYDVGKNMYVESTYFGYHELKYAADKHKTGHFITDASSLDDSNGVEILKLPESDFSLYNSKFTFIKNINDYKIYSWKSKDNKL